MRTKTPSPDWTKDYTTASRRGRSGYEALMNLTHPTDLATASRIRARQIGETDIPAIAGLLAKGFQSRPARFWSHVFTCLGERPVPAGLPRYGYLLENDATAVGAILLISSTVTGSCGTKIRCNISSVFEETNFSSYVIM